MNESYLDVTQESGRIFFTSDIEGPVVMLNLLRFNEIADFRLCSELMTELPISGRQCYKMYMKHTSSFLKQAGSDLLYFGNTLPNLIGPLDEKWDVMLLVKHASKEDFLKFATNEEYLKIKGYRTAALADSRLMPILEGRI
ncbi:MAG: hypothetical protein ACJA1A_000846 [Saprospiraceae bacterium]|jgi:uncharacterized protein (DUF1330 family)|tara:strand:- start:459 stop:881 length:423 start_codon:yes stop_codon:yes gene_type:complete